MFHFRVAVLFVVLIRCTTQTTNIPGKEITAYPSKVHQMFTEQRFKNDKLKKEGVWSSWSPWTPCSRSCGGGVTQQIRHCIPVKDSRNYHENWRLKLKKRNTKNHCIGIYKRFHLCNHQTCPIERDFRAEQCSHFNRYPFKGKLYYWEPFLQGGDECALNCRPLGLRFYATLNKTVIDGTSCLHPLSATGKAAPGGTKGVCVNGRCKSVAGNGVIGAIDELPEECAACSKGLCKSISGIYTKPDLPLGYSLIAQIPEGACKINIQQLQHTKNYIALRNANGSFIVNGDWKFSPSATIEAAGTRFFYKRNDLTALETVTALGPLINPVDLMIVYQQPNIGIKYGYMLPMSSSTSMEKIAPPYLKRSKYDVIEPRRLDLPMNSQKDEARVPSFHRKRPKRRFSWKAIGVTPCSKTCGGGMQTKKYSCVRDHTHTVVSEKRCTHVEHPPQQDFQCNMEPCPPYWKGTWSQCTGSCGQGVQHFIQRCQQEVSTRVVMLGDSACTQPKLTVENRPCELPKCETETDNELHQVSSSNHHTVEYQEWQVGPWTQCTVSCGTGQRTRSVSCLSGRCSYENRPPHAEYCDSGSCATNRNTSSWLVSEWSQCSESCGTGSQLRLSVCGKTECDDSLKPETTRSCSSDRYCVGQWFTGPWGSCSESCHEVSKQHRDVMCIIKVRGQSRITNDMTCSISEKPPTERLCQSDCPPRWFVGEWSICEGNCPAGVQRREVKCMEKGGALSNFCKEDDKPLVKRPCKCDKHDDQINIPAHDEPQDYNCVDKFSNCYLAVKARLCHYDYYVNNCCVSCRKVQQDLKQ